MAKPSLPVHCAVCKEVYKTLRLLLCHHCFCEECLEKLIMHSGINGSIRCPSCRQETPVPIGGAAAFPRNIDFPDEYLEHVRKREGRAMCSTHNMEELIFYCMVCLEPVCQRCKSTSHDYHKAVDLPEAVKQRRQDLEDCSRSLCGTMQTMEQRIAHGKDDLIAAGQKAEMIKALIRSKFESLLIRAEQHMKQSLENVDSEIQKMYDEFAKDHQEILRHRESVNNLLQQISVTLSSSNDGEIVRLAGQKRKQEGDWANLDEWKNNFQPLNISTLTLREKDDMDETLRSFFGSPRRLPLIRSSTSEVVNRLNQYEVRRQEVRAIYKLPSVSKIKVIYGDTKDEQEAEISIGNPARPDTHEDNEQTFRTPDFAQHHENLTEVSVTADKKFKVFLHSGNTVLLHTHTGVYYTLKGMWEPITADVSQDRKLLVILMHGIPSCDPLIQSEELMEASPPLLPLHTATYDPSGPRVHLFQLGTIYIYQKEYNPPNDLFFPSAISFWRQDGQEMLLIADKNNDSVNVVDAHDLYFLRYLAPGNPNILRPTALAVHGATVFIGCQNGAVLECKPPPGARE